MARVLGPGVRAALRGGGVSAELHDYLRDLSVRMSAVEREVRGTAESESLSALSRLSLAEREGAARIRLIEDGLEVPSLDAEDPLVVRVVDAEGVAMMRGARGADGPAGARGPRGTQGGQGGQGATGGRGPIGGRGAVGLPGLQGPQGQPGTAGRQGATGATGPQGGPGGVGATGTTGARGLTGPIGATGPVGPVGPRGADGVRRTATRASITGCAIRLLRGIRTDRVIAEYSWTATGPTSGVFLQGSATVSNGQTARHSFTAPGGSGSVRRDVFVRSGTRLTGSLTITARQVIDGTSTVVSTCNASLDQVAP